MSIDHVHDKGQGEIIGTCDGTRPEDAKSGRTVNQIPFFIYQDSSMSNLIGCPQLERGRCMLDRADMPAGSDLDTFPECKFVNRRTPVDPHFIFVPFWRV